MLFNYNADGVLVHEGSRHCWGSSGGPGIPEKSADELASEAAMSELLRNRFGRVEGVTKNMGGKFGVKATTTGEVVDNPAYAQAVENRDSINAQIEKLTRNGGGLSIDPRDGSGSSLAGLQSRLIEANKILKDTPKQIDTTKTDYTALSENEKKLPYLDAQGNPTDTTTATVNPNYDPNYAQTLSNLGLASGQLDTGEAELGKTSAILDSVNTDIGEMSRVTGLAETEITNLIKKYKDYDTETQTQIQKLTGANDEQIVRLDASLNYLTTVRADVEKTRGLAEEGVQKALKGELPPWLQQQIDADVNQQIEEQSRRFGASTQGRKGEITTQTKFGYVPKVLGVYDPIATGRTTIARGLTGDITSTGQTKLGNEYELANFKDKLNTLGIKNWQTTPALYGGLSDMYGNVATKRTGVAGERMKTGAAFTDAAKTRALLASTYNTLGQQGLQNIIDYTNLGA